MQVSTKLVPTFVFIISKATTVPSVRSSVHFYTARTIKMDIVNLKQFLKRSYTFLFIKETCAYNSYKYNGPEEAQFLAI